MKIAIYYPSIDLGGQQTYIYNLINGLCNRGHDVTWYYSYGTAFIDKVNKIAVTKRLRISLENSHYKTRPWKIVLLTIEIYMKLSKTNTQLIISNNAIGALVTGFSSKVLKIKNLWLVGGSLNQVNKNLVRFGKLINFDYFIDAYLAWPSVFKELMLIGAKNKKFYELPNAVDINHFNIKQHKDIDNIRTSLNLPKHAVVIGWVGRIAKNMQIWATLNVFQKLYDLDKNTFYLLVIGGGPEFSDLQKKIENSSFTNNVILLNWIKYEDVPKYISVMDIVPLLEHDPQGGSIIREAMSCGKVAISVAGHSGTQNRFMNDSNSVLVSPKHYVEDTVNWIYKNSNNKNVLKKIGLNARIYSERYMSFEHQINVIEKYINSIT
jgi:glycosyltransferase involved in cell wall biosynthesis